jgi:site-specific recombinase XerD
VDNHFLELLVKQYLAEKDISRGSFELYITILKQYMNYLITNQILYPTTEDVINYIEFKRQQGYSSQWIYHQINTLKGFYQYLSNNQKRLSLPEVYETDITVQIKNEPLKIRLYQNVLTTDQAKQLILNTKDLRRYIWHFRDFAIIYLMITTGLRSIEIRRARIKDLKVVSNQLVLYVQGKGRTSKDEFVKIPSGVKDAIDDYLSRRKDKNPYLFISHSQHTDTPNLSRGFFNEMFKRVLREAGLHDVKITPHALRHTAATLNLLRGGSLESTKVFMRHKDVTSTLIYAHHTNRLTDDSESKIEDYILAHDES